MARDDEFDWIDDAFDDKRTTADIERAKASKGAGTLLVVLLCACVAFMGFAIVSIMTAAW